MYGLKSEASFDSAHFLADYYGKCENLHGHRWRAVVHLAVDDLQAEGTMKGMVLDFGVFKRAVRELAEALDHTFLVEEGSLAPATLRGARGRGVQPVHRALPHHGGEPGALLRRLPG